MNIYYYLAYILSFLLFGYFVFRVYIRQDYEKNGKLSTFSGALEFLIFAVHANLSYTFLPVKWPGLPPLPANSLLLISGFGLMVVGLILTLWSMSGLGFKKAVGQEIGGLDRLGFYQYVRNPQISAYALIVIGLALLWPSFYSLGWVLVFFAIAHMMVKTEEEHLLKIFKEEYKEYCKEVGRYFPKINK